MNYLTKQEIFDKVATHLLAQGQRSLRAKGCSYRGDDGRTCAVGVLIPDEAYDPSIEGLTPACAIATRDQPHRTEKLRHALDLAGLNWRSEGIVGLLNALQRVHDGADPRDWEWALMSLATRHGLTMPDISQPTLECASEEPMLLHVQVYS